MSLATRGSPPNVNNELITDHPNGGASKLKAPKYVYRIHLETPITDADWQPLRDALAAQDSATAEAIILRNIAVANQSTPVKNAIRAALKFWGALRSGVHLLGSPPNVDNELVQDYQTAAGLRGEPVQKYRIHLDVPIAARHRAALAKALEDNLKQDAYDLVMQNIAGEDQSDAVKELVAAALGLDPARMSARKPGTKKKKARSTGRRAPSKRRTR